MKLVRGIIISQLKHKLINFLIEYLPGFFNISHNYISYKSLKQTYKFILKENIPNENILTAKDLLEFIENDCNGTDTCHIIGSGASALNTIKSIDKEHFVMGFNASTLIYERPNLHFLEYVNSKTEMDYKRSKILRKSFESISPSRIIWKNITGPEICFEKLRELYSLENRFLIDYKLIPFEKNKIKRTKDCLKKIVNASYKIGVPQYANTMVTLIGIASKVFKKIILHGCDMGGIRFFEDESFLKPDYLTNEELKLLKTNVTKVSNLAYEKLGVESDTISLHSLRIIIPKLIELNKQRGVIINLANTN